MAELDEAQLPQLRPSLLGDHQRQATLQQRQFLASQVPGHTVGAAREVRANQAGVQPRSQALQITFSQMGNLSAKRAKRAVNQRIEALPLASGEGTRGHGITHFQAIQGI